MNFKGLKMKIASVACAFTALISLAGTAGAAYLWDAKIKASYGYDTNMVTLGAASDATDGFENGYDGRAIVAGSLMTYFYHPEWMIDTEYFWNDIRSAEVPKEWVFYISSGYTNKTITLTWELNIPSTLTLTLFDDTAGTSVDLAAQTSYAYTNTSTSSRAFRVAASGSLPGNGGSGGEGGSTPPADTTAPDTSITGITDNQVFSTSTVNAGLSGTDDISAASALQYSYMIDSGSWSDWSADTTAALSGVSDGAHVLYAKAKDEAGNEDASPAQVSFKVDTAAPQLSILNYETTATTKMTYTVKVNCSTSDAVSGVQSLSYSVSDEYNLVSLNGSVTPPSGDSFNFTVDLDRKIEPKDRYGRVYTITVTATDKAGYSTTQSTTYTVSPLGRRKPLR